LTTARTLFNFKVIVKGQGHFFVSGPKLTKLLSSNVKNRGW